MPNNRTIQISLDHLVAEVMACPLVLEAAYQHGLYEIDCEFQKSAGQKVWRAAEHYLMTRFPHTSIDEIVSLRNRLWFGQHLAPANSDIPLHQYFSRVAREFLEPRGTFAVPRLPPAKHHRGGIDSGEAPDPAARRAWRWLTFALPEDLLLAGLDTGHHSPTRVQVVSENVAALLRRGYAETHLHFGVAFDFSMAWAATTNIAGRMGGSASGLAFSAFHSPGADHSEGDDLAIGLLRGLLVRYFLGAFLSARQQRQTDLSLGAWLIDRLANPNNPLPKNVVASDVSLISRTLQQVQRGLIGIDPEGGTPARQYVALQSVYGRWTKVSTRPYPEQLSEVQRLDPLSDFFSAGSPGPSVQLQFLRSGFAYIQQHPLDEQFAQLFWQAERVRCHVYRHCVQRPMTPGLTNFVRFYERKSAIAGPLDNILIESAAMLGGIGNGLASLEVRTSPRKNRDAQRVDMLSLQQSFGRLRTKTSSEQLETGLVLHFLKKRGAAFDNGHPCINDHGDYADPQNSQNPSGFRWQGYFLIQERFAKAIGNALAVQPELLKVVRAIDVCRDEPGVPTWVIAPLYETVRRKVEALRTDWATRQGAELPVLRATAHVGEDFVHLASGVRFMDEALRLLPLGSGDRVGHGLALGVDPIDWASRNTRLAMPREDRWFDLLWERCWHGDQTSRFTSARRVFVEDEILRLANVMFTGIQGIATWTVPLALDCVHALHDIRRLRTLGFPNHSIPATLDGPIDQWLVAYLTGRRHYQECRVVEWVESKHDGEATAELQRLVRQRYADLGITIEINPISNLLVGDLSDLRSHPLWRLAPGLGDHVGPTMRMCVGSDDPFPFATSLPEEYQFLFDSLVLAGRSAAEAREWLDLIRQMGLESRFTLKG